MPPIKKYDAIVIGGGHNGLTAAAYFARAGKEVLVLERRYVLGGAAVTEEVFPGFKFSVCSYVVSLLKANIIRELMLPKFGLELLPLESTFTPLENDYLMRTADPDETYREMYRHSPRDAETYTRFGPLMGQIGMAVRPILETVPPNAIRPSFPDLSAMKKLLNHFKTLSDEQFEYLTKLMTMSSADFLDEWFEFEPLKATMAASGIIGTFMGPRSPGSAYVMLHHYMGDIDGAFRAWGFQRGGTGAVSMAIARSAEYFGAKIMTEAPVEKVIVKNGRAIGVALENGDEYKADKVISGLDPKLSFLKMVDEIDLPNDFVTDIKNFRIRGSSGKVNLALDALPEFTCLPGNGPHLRGAISISPDFDYIEKAYDDANEPSATETYFQSIDIPILGRIEAPGTLEGGDVIWINERIVAVGEGYRSNAEGIRQFQALLGNLVEKVITVPLPHWTGPTECLHLMSNVSPIDHDLYLVYSRLLPVFFRQYLIDSGIELLEVPDKEYNSMGCNVLAIAPRKCIMIAGNPKIQQQLEAKSVEVHIYDGSEISLKGTGGPTCLTRPFLRSES